MSIECALKLLSSLHLFVMNVVIDILLWDD